MKSLVIAALLLSSAGVWAQTLPSTPNLGLQLIPDGYANWGTPYRASLNTLDAAAATYRGLWSSSTVYTVGQFVTYGGAIYLSTLRSNLNNAPSQGTGWVAFTGTGSTGITAISINSLNGFMGSSSGGSTPSITLTVDGSHYLPLVTDASSWNGKQSALGFTPENVANKDASGGYAGLSGLFLKAAEMPAFTGDATSAAGAIALTLATVNTSPGACGDATHVCAVTTNGKGLVTSQSQVAIPVGGTVTGFSSGGLASLFSTAVSTSTTTPAQSFSASAAAQNAVLAGPTSGGSGAYSFRSLVAGDVPALPYLPSATQLPVTKAGVIHQFFTSFTSSTGAYTAAQPGFADISGSVAASQLPSPTATTLGGVQSYVAASNQFIDSISTAGLPHSRAIAVADVPTLNQNTTGNAATATVANSALTAPLSGLTGNLLNVPGVLNGNVTNGMYNSDRFRSGGTGNDGIPLAFTACSGPCTVVVPPTSTDTEQFTISGLASGQRLIDYRFNNIRTSVVDPLRVGGICDGSMVAFCDSVIFSTPSTFTDQDQELRKMYSTFNSPSWNYGNAPNAFVPFWAIQKTLSITSRYNSRGISQDFSVDSVKHTTGDYAPLYIYGWCDGGQPDYSGEGCTGMTLQTGQTSDYFHGTVGSSATTGMTSLPIVYNVGISSLNRNATTDGSYMLDISKGTIAGGVAGAATKLGGYGDAWLLPVSNTLTPSTAYGNMGCELMEPSPIPTPVSATCNVTGILGTNAGGFVAGQPTIIGGDFPEQVVISAVGTISGGTQSVTFTYLHPHGQSLTTLWQGGPAGQFASYDELLAINGFRQIMNVYGATDSSHLAITSWRGGKPQSPYIAPASINTLTKSGTTFTANFINNQVNQFYSYQNMAAATITGCSDSALNGTLTNINVDPVNFVITGTQTAGGSGCASASISLPSTYFGYHLYPGAEVRGPSIAAPGNAVLEPNYVAWTSGDTLEEPLHPFFSSTNIRTVHVVNNTFNQNSNTSGQSFEYKGAGISGSYHPLVQTIDAPCSLYVGCGGVLTPVPFWTMNGSNGGAMVMNTAPMGALFTVGCLDAAFGGCSNLNKYVLFNLHNGSGQITYDTATNELGGVNFNAGTGYVKGATGTFTAGTVNGSPICTTATGCGAPSGVSSIDTLTGAFTFGGPGVSHVGNAYTFSGSGSGIASIAWALPSWLTASPTTISANGTQTFSATTGQTANQFLATPNGGTGAVGLRAIAVADVPTLNQNTTGTAANLSGTPALPNGTTATTQTVGDNSTKVATTAFVLANGGSYTLPQATTSVLGGVKCDGTTITCTAGVISSVTGGSGNTTSTALTTNAFPRANGPASLINSAVSDDGTTVTSTEPVAVNSTGPSQFALTYHSTSPTVGSSTTAVYAVNSSGQAVASEAAGSFSRICTAVNGVCSGSGIANITVTMPTSAIAANTCTTAATATMTGLATTSVFATAFATNPNAVTGWGSTGGLTFTAWPTANTLNWSVCNSTAASITPGAMTLNVGAR